MEHLAWEDRPRLRRPVLVAAFEGWNDAGDAATTAARFLRDHWAARQFASVDPEEFYDFSSTRPQVHLVDGLTREITWPANELFAASLPGNDQDVVVMLGVEPGLRWRTFTSEIVEAAKALGVELLITLGALLADVPHTRPVSITGLASDEEMVERLGLGSAQYEGPTGITGVLHGACAEAGMPSASLWAAVPHYIAATPNPKAALALVRRLEGLVGVSVDASELEEAASDYERQVSLAVQSDPDVQAFVERLEAASDDDPPLNPGQMPSGDTIAREFQRFLRQRGPEG